MNCDCISGVTKKLTERYATTLGVPAEVLCQNEGLAMSGNSFVSTIYMNFKITAQAKGFVKGKTIPVHANFCPICGVAAKKLDSKP